MYSFNDRIRQVLLLLLILFLVFLTIKELTLFLPGLLGAVTLYILSRKSYFQLVYKRKWKKGRAAGLFIFYYLVILGFPIYLAVLLISPKINSFLNNPQAMITASKESVMQVQDKLGFHFVSDTTLSASLSKLSAYIPTILNSSATLVTNLAIMLFLLYYMLYNGRAMEKYLNKIIPLKQANINMLAQETRTMVRANALGIPLISIIQGLTATLGYFLFGVHEWALWGFLTGVFAFFPVVGTMVVWVPLVIYLYATDQTWHATAVLIYSVIVTGNIDYIARITLLRRMADVHPIITILGVIVGLGLFGFIGLIFGPLLINYIIVLFDIYMNEFVGKQVAPVTPEVNKPPEEKEEEMKK